MRRRGSWCFRRFVLWNRYSSHGENSRITSGHSTHTISSCNTFWVKVNYRIFRLYIKNSTLHDRIVCDSLRISRIEIFLGPPLMIEKHWHIYEIITSSWNDNMWISYFIGCYPTQTRKPKQGISFRFFVSFVSPIKSLSIKLEYSLR